MKSRVFNTLFIRISAIAMIGLLMVQSISFAISSVPLDIPVPELRSAVLDIGSAKEIPAYKDGVALQTAVDYSDIKGVLNEKQIVRMAALGIIKRRGQDKFYPSKDVTRFEAIEYLDRLIGAADGVEENVQSSSSGLSDGSVNALYDEQYAQIALDRGILKEDDYIRMNESVTREQFAIWLSNAIGLEPVYGDIDRIFGMSDYMDVTPAYRGIIEALLREGIMSSKNDGAFHPKDSISRAECMGILDRALETQYDKRGITTGYGLVVGIKQNDEKEVGYSIVNRDYIIRNVDGSITKISTKNNPHTRQKSDFVLFKSGFQLMSDGVVLGDELYYIAKDKQLVYAEMPSDNSIIDKIRHTESKDANLTTYFGTIYEIVTQKYVKGDSYTRSQRFRVQTFDGQTFDIIVDTDIYTGVKNDIIVQKNNKIAGTDMLQEGDTISFVVKNNQHIVYISTQPFWEKTVKGTLRKITSYNKSGNPILGINATPYPTPQTTAPNKKDDKNNTDDINDPNSPNSRIVDHRIIEIFGYDDVIYEYNIANYASLHINGITADYSDLRYGQNVILQIKHGYVISINADSFQHSAGYIPKYGKSRSGTLYKVYHEGFVLDTGIAKNSYNLAQDVVITKGGIPITYQALKEGDKVKVFFDDIYTDRISKMEVEGISRVIKKVYKGQLSDVDAAQNEITLTSVRYLKNNYWEPTSSYTKNFPLSDNVYIYVGNRSVPIGELKRNYRDKTLYVVVEEVFGRPVASQITLKSGGENIYNDTVKDVDNVLSRVELDNNINFDITKGTIVVKDGRAVSSDILKKHDNVMIISDFSVGQTRANVIKVIGKEERVFDRVYVGVIEMVAKNYFTTKFWSRMNDNAWDDVDEGVSDKFYYHTNTDIFDVTDKDKIKKIRQVDFFHRGYGRMENVAKTPKDGSNKGVKNKRYYTLFVTKSDDAGRLSVVSMKIRFKGFLPDQNIDDKIKDYSSTADKLDDMLEDMFLTRGVVSEIETKWERIKLTDTNDWVSSAGEWRTNDNDTHVEYEDSLVIKGDKPASIDDIKAGDELYILRNNEKAQVIFIAED